MKSKQVARVSVEFNGDIAIPRPESASYIILRLLMTRRVSFLSPTVMATPEDVRQLEISRLRGPYRIERIIHGKV